MVGRIEIEEGSTFQFYYSTRINTKIIWIVGSLVLPLKLFEKWVHLSSTTPHRVGTTPKRVGIS